MAVPKGKISKARRDKRRNSHWKLSLPGMTKCPKCGEMVSMKRLAFASRGTYRARLGYVPGANQRVLAGILICFLVSKATYMLRLFVNFLRKFY